MNRAARSPLRELASLVELNPTVSLARVGLHPFVAMEDISPGRRHVRSVRTRELTGGARFAPGDTLLARITPCLENGKTAQFDPAADRPGFGSTEFIVFRARPGLADPTFVFYLATSTWVREPAIASMAGASGRQRVRLEAVAGALVPSFPLQQQIRIGSILGAHDDLIEVNRRRIAVLEEMARRLFEEWFVHFRFPGYETLASPAAGGLPNGWAASKLADVCALISRGIAPTYDDASTALVIGQKCVRDKRLSLGPARPQRKPVPAEKLVRVGDVLINSTGVGTLGRVAQVEDVPAGTTVDSHVTIVRPTGGVDRDYFGLAVLRLEDMFERMGAGATGQTELSRTRVAEVEMLLPPTQLQQAFGRHARPLRALAHKLGRQNERLAASRDFLLPRLISGDLPVAAAEHELEAVA